MKVRMIGLTIGMMILSFTSFIYAETMEQILSNAPMSIQNKFNANMESQEKEIQEEMRVYTRITNVEVQDEGFVVLTLAVRTLKSLEREKQKAFMNILHQKPTEVKNIFVQEMSDEKKMAMTFALQVTPLDMSDPQNAEPLADKVATEDSDGDGVIDTWVYFHYPKTRSYKQSYDFTKDRKVDFYESIDENTGRVLSVEIDRNTWSILTNIGTAKWKQQKKEDVKLFWESKAEGNEVKDKITGEVLFHIPPHDPTRQTALCDICNVKIKRGEGYLLTTKEVLSNEQYVHKKSLMLDTTGASKTDLEFAQWKAFFSTAANTPWLVGEECIGQWMAK